MVPKTRHEQQFPVVIIVGVPSHPSTYPQTHQHSVSKSTLLPPPSSSPTIHFQQWEGGQIECRNRLHRIPPRHRHPCRRRRRRHQGQCRRRRQGLCGPSHRRFIQSIICNWIKDRIILPLTTRSTSTSRRRTTTTTMPTTHRTERMKGKQEDP